MPTTGASANWWLTQDSGCGVCVEGAGLKRAPSAGLVYSTLTPPLKPQHVVWDFQRYEAAARHGELTNVTQRTHVLVEVDVEKFVRIVRRFVFHLIVGQSSSLTNTDKLRPSLLHDKLTYSLVS